MNQLKLFLHWTQGLKTPLALAFFISTFIFQADAQPSQPEMKLSRTELKQIRSLARDLVSVGIDHDFTAGKINNRAMVRFGIYQIALHQIHLFKDEKNGRIWVPARAVAAATQRYFGQIPVHQSIQEGDWTYRKGRYYGYPELFEQLGFETVKRCQVESNNRGSLTVYVDYIDGMADTVMKTKMTLKQVGPKGQKRFILWSYRSLTRRAD